MGKGNFVVNNYDPNLSTYKEKVFEEVSYEKPKVIFGKLESIEKSIDAGLKELKTLIK